MIAVTRGKRPEWAAVRRLLLAALPLALLALPVDAAERGVDIRDNSYSPTPVTVTAGDTVKWTHRGNVLHTVTADDNSFNSENMLPGNTYTHVFPNPGTYGYHCTIHGNAMHGTVVVQTAAQTTTTTRPSTTTTTRRTTTTLAAGESSVTAPGETTTTSTDAGETTTTLVGDTTTSTDNGVAAPVDGDTDPSNDDPSNAGAAAVAALLLAAVSGGAALAVKRGL